MRETCRHLVAEDHVKCSVAVPHRLGEAALVARRRRRRAGRVVRTATLGVHQERLGRLADHLTRLVGSARPHLQHQHILYC